MALWDSIMGYVKCQLISASLEDTINMITTKYSVYHLELIDSLTATFWVKRSDFAKIEKITEHIEAIKYTGAYWNLRKLIHRPIIVVGVTVLLFLIFYLPTRVLFINVYGNNHVPVTSVLDAAQNCGVRFGVSRELVRSEKVKNGLMQSIPQLQWACINTRGCVAEIFVQERSSSNNGIDQSVTNLVAGCDGIITDLTVYSGSAVCRVGQVVEKGQLLVSGYSDLGLLIRSDPANAEIMAETNRSVFVVTLLEYIKRESLVKETDRYSLLVGKKLIKFYKGSGISLPECGRINKIYRLTLPGGFTLPLSIVKERIIYYDTAITINKTATDYEWLQESADSIVRDQMVAGKIIKRAATVHRNNGVQSLFVKYRCNEMIAIPQKREMYTFNGTRN